MIQSWILKSVADALTYRMYDSSRVGMQAGSARW